MGLPFLIMLITGIIACIVTRRGYLFRLYEFGVKDKYTYRDMATGLIIFVLMIFVLIVVNLNKVI